MLATPADNPNFRHTRRQLQCWQHLQTAPIYATHASRSNIGITCRQLKYNVYFSFAPRRSDSCINGSHCRTCCAQRHQCHAITEQGTRAPVPLQHIGTWSTSAVTAQRHVEHRCRYNTAAHGAPVLLQHSGT